MSDITTHVLDTSAGRPAVGVPVLLEIQSSPGVWREISRGATDSDGRLRATFEVVWLSGWAPHPRQQQPLKPGTAKARLADALGTREISSGEKAGS